MGFQRTCPSDNFRTLWQTKHKVDVLLTRKPLLIGGIKYHFQMVLLVDPHFGTRIVHIPFRMSPRWFPTVGTAFALKQDVPKAVWRDAPGKVSSDVCWWLAPKKGATVRLGSLNVPIEHHPTKIGIWSMPWLLWLVMSFIYPKWDRQTNPCQTWMFSIVFPWHSIPCHLNLDCSKNFPNSPRHPLAAISNLPFEGLAHRAGKQRSRLSGVLVTPVFRISMAMMAKKHRLLNHSLDWFKGKSTGNHGFYHQI